MIAAAIREGLAEIAQALRDGFTEVAGAIETAGVDVAEVLEAAIGSMEEKLAGIDGELDANGRVTVEALRGIEDALRQPLVVAKGKPCRRGT